MPPGTSGEGVGDGVVVVVVLFPGVTEAGIGALARTMGRANAETIIPGINF